METYPALVMGALAIGEATGGCAGMLQLIAGSLGLVWPVGLPADELQASMLLLAGSVCAGLAAWSWWHRHWRLAVVLTPINLLLATVAT